MPKRSTASSEPSPLPVPVCEALGLASVRQLSELFHSECAALGGRKLHSHFEQWLWSARAGVSEGAPVIPHPPAAEASTALRRKLVCAGMSEEAALAATAALEQRAKALAGRLACARAAAGPQQAASEVRLSGSGSGGTVTLSCGGESVVCKRSHLEKLRALLRSGDAGDAAAASGERLFERRAYCVLARVLALQGGEPRAGGMQAAVGYRVFDALARHHGAAFELFASPLNARFSSFCSAAPDVDRAFGSVGSFFSPSLDPLLASGAFQANPPYDPPLVAAMGERMHALLASADARRDALTFIVIIPHWQDKPCWRALEQSCRCSAHLRLPQAEHGFFEGGQHYRPALWRAANHDTSLFFLQSAAAPRPSEASLAALRTAFRAAPSALEPPIGGAELRPRLRPPSEAKGAKVRRRAEGGGAPVEAPLSAKRAALLSRPMAELLAGTSGKQRRQARKRLKERKRKAMITDPNAKEKCVMSV
ncbi:hypothetical protein EMIHUDRAFT_422415 [Emiliania huxleyi CCMP1516]|uniref:PCIF1 WW domain-containing protein n=2 Tax=Emiliania huxleyi TaxID=2903 RepID=A0A0D3ICM6_EMIH1|nr:hypothetical protein EMIHUDRAFT_422415 [Emiliania huxleyi CCMP1516]EOD09011.1 hypothetical protein EMIHUDRAFT_422415 [Emiliania huxleyi CCMP1516]|eukprot:XP_005761440.1 hypothetical protein EMIHUDRAFT_422415 [Emiliania huxleyi CCMP1516]